MKDILFIRAASSNVGGIEGQIIRIAKRFALIKLFNPILVTSTGHNVFAERFEDCGFPVYKIQMDKSDILKGSKAIESILNKHNIGVIQSHMFRDSFIGRKVRMKHPEILHLFRAHTYIDCAWVPFWKKSVYHIIDKLTSKYVDLFIANGKYLAKEIVDHSWISPTKIRIVRNGREYVGLPDLPEDNLEASLSSRIAMVSNLLLHKGHDVLIRALSLLKQKGLIIRARLIGGESTGNRNANNTLFTDSLKTEAQELGVLDQIEFHGYTRNVYEALKGFSIVILPSDREGIPNCILEALSLRKLVIASNVGGIPEIIENGVSGLLHPPQDPKALADILEKVFTRPAKVWEPMRNAGYKTWKEQFSMEHMMDGLINIYRELNLSDK